MDEKEFHIGDILSITTGRLVSLDHIDGVYNILNYMTGDNLFTHQLPRAARECEGFLLEQHPDLADIKVPEITCEAECITWLASIYPTYGERRMVNPLPKGSHTVIDPISEIKMIRPDIQIISVNPEDIDREE